MQATVSCPSLDDYQRLIRGELSTTDAERIGRHLGGCSSCAAAVQSLLDKDSLLAGILNSPADVLTREEVPTALIRRSIARSASPSAESGRLLPPSLPSLLNPPQAADEIGRLAHYRVLKVLGTGGMGVVFLTQDLLLGRTVALKTMKPEIAAEPQYRQRFLREARAAAKVENDHIVPIYGVGEDRGIPWLAMPFLKGESLEELLQRVNVLEPAQAARLGAQVAKGLAAAHAAGLIHRDVKPANVWVEPEGGGRAKLLDFGLARDDNSDQEEGERLTQTGMIFGTPGYLAPEQAQGESLDGRADLFSLGCVLYRAVTGRLPFPGKGMMGALRALATETPPAPHEINPDVPQPLSELMMALLAKDRSARPASAVAAALETLAEQSGEPAPVALPLTPRQADGSPATDVPAVPQRPGATVALRRRGRLLITAVLLLAFGGALATGIVVIIKNKPGTEAAVSLSATGVSTEIKPPGDSGKAKIDPVKVNTDRRAAEWVLSVGGGIRIRQGAQERNVSTAKDLPAGPFELVEVKLSDNRKVDDDGLEHLEGLTELAFLYLSSTGVSDAGLVHLKKLTNLLELDLGNLQLGDAGLTHLKGLTKLRLLSLDGTRVSDAGLKHLEEMTWLLHLGLRGTRVSSAGLAKFRAPINLRALLLGGMRITDAGLVHLKELSNLRDLFLVCTQVSDTGLEHLKGMTNLINLALIHAPVSDAGLVHLETLNNLTGLWLQDTQVSDAGLEHLKRLTKLRGLNLHGTRVSDAGLKHLAGMSNLRDLDLTDTQVTPDGVAALQKALPKCKIVSNPGTK